MGKGIDAARDGSPLHDVLDDFKDQLLIVMIKRLGGKVSIPAAEVDATGGNVVMCNIVDGVFNFETRRKS